MSEWKLEKSTYVKDGKTAKAEVYGDTLFMDGFFSSNDLRELAELHDKSGDFTQELDGDL